jgi:hypothetical protein
MTPTPPSAAVPAQPDALQIEAAYDGETLIGYRLTGSGNPDGRALVWTDQQAMPGIRAGNEFVPGYGKRIDYRPLSLHAQVAALTAQPDPLKDHQVAALVNELRDIAVQYHGTQQLRERIAQVVVPALRGGASQGAAERAVPATDWAEEVGRRLLALAALKKRTDSMPVMNEIQWLTSLHNRMLAASPAQPAPEPGHVQKQAEIEHVEADVSKNGQESNMTGGAYAELADKLESGAVAVGSDGEWVSIRRHVRDEAVQALRASHGQAPAAIPAQPAPGTSGHGRCEGGY